MNFYTAQDQARKSTRFLLVLFTLLNIGLVILINLLFAWYLWVNDDPVTAADRVFFDYLSWQRMLIVAGGVALLLLFAAWLKWLDVREGGGAVAELMGGERVLHTAPDARQRQLLNIVEEMAIASGMPVPPVYMQRHEPGINAFAAGLNLSDAAICVTQGAVQGLSRDQMQGVIAHEFSHILNGDMRLNMRLMVVLHGMVFFGELGRVFTGSRGSWWADTTKHKGSSRGSLVLLGIGLIIVGWLGVLLGRMIKAAISRQREYLADASAVQFTRNPEAVAGALKVIGGSQFQSDVDHPNSQEAGHLFFAAISPMQLWSTHPPLNDRIRRIDPRWDGQYLEPLPPPLPKENLEARKKPKAQVIDAMIGTLATAELMSDGDFLFGDTAPVSDELDMLLHDPYDARVVLLGLLLDPLPEPRALQQKLIAGFEAPLADKLNKHLELFDDLPRERYLTLIEKAIPALKAQSLNQYKAFKRLLIKVVQADRQIDLFEWTLYQLVSRYCDAHFGLSRAKGNRYSDIADVASHYAVVLSTLAYYGHDNAEDAQRAFNVGASTAGLYNLQLLAPEQCERKPFAEAVGQLALATPFVRQRLMKGLVKVARQDGEVVPLERELLSAVAAVMESPLIGLDD
ncbi:MAG: M48 family metallopeptidase [Amphritea sp.]|nr:M48 family metallopeptidase [Amphritea sp.]